MFMVGNLDITYMNIADLSSLNKQLFVVMTVTLWETHKYLIANEYRIKQVSATVAYISCNAWAK